jgi:hypothetical protein
VSYGGICFLNNNTLLIGGDANRAGGAIYQIGVVRNASNQITGFTGTATKYKDAGFIDGGLTFGTGSVLFAVTFDILSPGSVNGNRLFQYKPGSPGLAPDKIIDLTPLGVNQSTGSIQFVPAGFPGAGGVRFLSYGLGGGAGGGQFYTATLTPDGTGTYNVSGVTLQATLPGTPGPVGIVYVPPGSPIFGAVNRYALISEYAANRVSVYQLDASGYPMGATRGDFVAALNGAEGAILDPVTNDFLFSTFGASNRVIRVSGFAAPPGVAVTESGGTTNVAEGGATDTYTVVLNTAPTANVTVTLSPGTQVTVAPTTLTFTPANWNVPQTVTVTAVDDAMVEGAHTGTITHTAASTDAIYNGIAVASVTANITDNDTGGSGPSPGGGNEGSYAGSSGGKPVPEGGFGYGGRARRPTLAGPFVHGLEDLRVENVAHRQHHQAMTPDEDRHVPIWTMAITGIVLTLGALLLGKR